MYEAYDIVRELAGADGHVVPGHDPDVMERYPRLEAYVSIGIEACESTVKRNDEDFVPVR